MNTALFGSPIAVYSRAQALEDGFQVDISETAREAGIKFPVFVTRALWNKFVAVPPNVEGQDEAGRLWDVVYMTALALRRASGDTATVSLYVRNDNRRPKLVSLKAVCGALDFNDPQPAITLMLPEED